MTQQQLIERVELHDTLNPRLWDGTQLRPEVAEKLEEIVDQFTLELNDNDIPIKVLDARLVGSNASFNYTDKSDLDVHIVANFNDTSCDVPVLNLLYNYFKKNFNDKYEISIHGVPVELYVEDVNAGTVSNGIYSLFEEEWIKFPEPVEIPDVDITDLFSCYEEKYNQIIADSDSQAASDLIDQLYLLRKDSIAADGEYGKGNLVFKEFRNQGYLDNLKQLLVDETSKELSLESLNETLSDFDTLLDATYQYYKGPYGANESLQLTESDHTQAAIAEFGTTFYKTRAGFMLKDGSLLDLTYGGQSRADHRDIGAIYDDMGFDTASQYLIEFMKEGNIRLSPEVPGINILEEPTDDQYKALADYIQFWINREKRFAVDYTDERGNTVDAQVYNGFVSPKEIILDIKEHFDDLEYLEEQYSLLEEDSGNWGYHYGDLGNKADRRDNFGSRNSGGFGTGTYFVGTPISQRRDGGSYRDRPEHKVDFSKYNLFRPRNNEEAYRLHDALLTFNNMASDFKGAPPTPDQVLTEYEKMTDQVFAEINALDPDDITTPAKIDRKPLLKYIRKYIDLYPYKIGSTEYEDLHDVAQYIRDQLLEQATAFRKAVWNLSSAVHVYNEDKLRKIIIDALLANSDKSPATLIMQNLGYEGIDVRHLNHDAQGLAGLDNFGYGSVIYDLKEDVEETGRTVIKAVVFHNEDQPKKQVSNFQDFEIDGLYRLGESDYIAFEKRWEEDPRGWGMIHADIVDDFILPAFPDYKDRYAEEVGLEIDNLQLNSDPHYSLKKLNTKTFSKYTNTIKKAVDSYFR